MNAFANSCSPSRGGLRATIRGILARELIPHASSLAGMAALWVVCLWILPLNFHPLLMLALGGLMALKHGGDLGGRDTLSGSEEFSLALPPTRGDLFFTRFLLGAAPVFVLTATGCAAIALDLPQWLWSAVVESGFTGRHPPVDTIWWYGLAIIGPLWIFAVQFVSLSTARRGGGSLRLFWWTRVFAVLIFTAGAILRANNISWRTIAAIATIACSVTFPLIVAGGFFLFRQKESIPLPGEVESFHAPAEKTAWAGVALAILLILPLLFWLGFGVSRKVAVPQPSATVTAKDARPASQANNPHSEH